MSATVVAPGHSKVIPLMPEFVATQDGAEKQDCERNAVKRWFSTHGARLAPLRPIFLGDDLFACHPVAKRIMDAGDDFIFTAKESSHKALYDFINGSELARHEEKVRRRATKETFRYRWIEGVPIRDGKDALLVNWIGFEIVDAKGNLKYSLPVRLTHTPATCRVRPFAGIKLGIGRRLYITSDAEQRAEGVERVEAPVEAKREFVEVGL